MKERIKVDRLACLAALVVAGGFCSAALAQTRTLRIVTYNIEADTGGYVAARPGLITPSTGGSVTNGGVLEGIGEEALGNDPPQPLDILALQETTANITTVIPIVNGLNAYYGVPWMYTSSPYQATESGGFAGSGNGPNAIIYNTTTVQLLASVPVDPAGGVGQLGSASGEYREVMRYEFAPAGVMPTPANEFYIYVSHYKASTGSQNELYRSEEAQIIRNNSATLPATARILYVGDYNVTTSTEAGYQTIVRPGVNQGIDPMNPSGATGVTWETNTLVNLKSESATDLRYRDDLQISTSNVYYGLPGGLALVHGTYHVFGNNGSTPYQGTVASSNSALTNLAPSAPISAAQLYQDLTTASDHLPVVADYTIPLPPAPPVASFTANPTTGVAALAVIFTDTSMGVVTNWYWDFGDGSNTNLATNATAHVYHFTGNYTVTELVSGPGGLSTNVVPGEIIVLAPTLPAAQITQSGGSLLLSWPTPAIAYQLLSAPSPLGPWTADSSTLATNGGWVSTVLAPTNDQRYYRLQGQ